MAKHRADGTARWVWPVMAVLLLAGLVLAGVLAVAIGARVGAIAGPSEVLVSQTIKDLTAGAGITFADRGDHELKGVPGPWRLFAAS